MLVRGSILKNTQWIIGICIYCGNQSKIFKNARKPLSKSSHVMKVMNKILYTVFAFQAIMCLSLAMASIIWQSEFSKQYDYLRLNTKPTFQDYIVRIFVFLVAYSQLIPISLYVALEIMKLVQGYFIANDSKMFYAPIMKQTKVKTSDLIEELGQIDFLFSDKTGTLTRNEMKFRKCYVDGVIYGGRKNNSRVFFIKIEFDQKISFGWRLRTI